MTSTVYYYSEDDKVYIIKHSDKEYMTEAELVNSVGIQITVQQEMNFAPEVTDFFMCDGKPKQCVIVMKKVGTTSYKDRMTRLIKELKHVDKIDQKCVKIYENIMHFYSAIKLCNYMMNYQLGIIHGDLHRGNIQLDIDAESNISKIYYIDFDYSIRLYEEARKIDSLKGIERLNFINYVNHLANKNNLHVSKMILDYCNELMTALSLYNCPFSTPLAMSNSIKITNSDDIQSVLQRIFKNYVFTSRNPLCGLLVLMMYIYDDMYSSYVTAPYQFGHKDYIYNDTSNVKQYVQNGMKSTWKKFDDVYGLNYHMDENYDKLLPKMNV
jgi:hypothetical protein